MANRNLSGLCPDDKLSRLIAAMGRDEAHGMRELDILLRDFAGDPRLHFLKGSLLAGRQDYAAARAEMRHAVDLAPGYAVARFQLGFLLLTSGEAQPAQETWEPLRALPENNYLRLFADGLGHLIRDEFADTIRVLEAGIARNTENPPMNRDMRLIIDEVRGKMTGTGEASAATSSVDFLLQQAALKATRH